MDKITPDIDYHFGRDLELMSDYLNMTRDDFLLAHLHLTMLHYLNTNLYCLQVLNLVNLITKPIGEIDGIYIKKLCRNKGLNPYYLLTICS